MPDLCLAAERAGIVAETSVEHLGPDEVFAFLVDDLRSRPGWNTPCVYGPRNRTRQSIELWALLD